MTSTAAEARFDVLAVGNAIVDVLALTDDAFLDEHGMAKGGMQLIDDVVVHRLYDAMPPGVEVSGGSAANTVVGVASFGGRVAFIGRVADDQLGEVFAHDIRNAGVHFEPLAAAASGPATARCLILVTPDAQRTMNTYLGASATIGPADIDPELVASAAVLYVEGYLWDQPDAKAAILTAMDASKAAGRKVAFTLSDSFCVDRHRREFLGLLDSHVDILFANEDEICSLFEADTFEEAVEKLNGSVSLACLTRSEKGSMIIESGVQRVGVPAHPVDEVVDTTGAGDLYAAGVLYGLSTGRDLAAAARLGSLAASEIISHLGPRPQRSLSELAVEFDL